MPTAPPPFGISTPLSSPPSASKSLSSPSPPSPPSISTKSKRVSPEMRHFLVLGLGLIVVILTIFSDVKVLKGNYDWLSLEGQQQQPTSSGGGEHDTTTLSRALMQSLATKENPTSKEIVQVLFDQVQNLIQIQAQNNSTNSCTSLRQDIMALKEKVETTLQQVASATQSTAAATTDAQTNSERNCPKPEPCPVNPECPKAEPCPAASECPKPEPCPVCSTESINDKSLAVASTTTSAAAVKPSLYVIYDEMKQGRNTLQSNTRVVANVVPRGREVDADDPTLVTHISPNKMDRLLVLEQFWQGPLSVAVWIKDEEAIQQFYEFVKAQPASLRKAASYHCLVEYNPEMLYPHNKLRNLAVRYMDSDFFVSNDADIVTNWGAYHDIVRLMKSTAVANPEEYDPNAAGVPGGIPLSLKEQLKHRSLFVLPAFERYLNKGETDVSAEQLPKTKQDLMALKKKRSLVQFYKGYQRIQGPTDFATFYGNKTDWHYSITYKAQFEPYVLGYRHGIPQYWEAMRGFGWNKQSWFREAGKMKYKFFAFRDLFMVHRNHPQTRKKGKEQQRNRKPWGEFKSYLLKRYYLEQPFNGGKTEVAPPPTESTEPGGDDPPPANDNQ